MGGRFSSLLSEKREKGGNGGPQENKTFIPYLAFRRGGGRGEGGKDLPLLRPREEGRVQIPSPWRKGGEKKRKKLYFSPSLSPGGRGEGVGELQFFAFNFQYFSPVRRRGGRVASDVSYRKEGEESRSQKTRRYSPISPIRSLSKGKGEKKKEGEDAFFDKNGEKNKREKEKVASRTRAPSPFFFSKKKKGELVRFSDGKEEGKKSQG